MQRVRAGFADDDFGFIQAAPVTAVSPATPAGAAPGTRPRLHRLVCRFAATSSWKINMKTILHPRFVILALALCAGCTANHVVDSPKSITFVQAMHDVGQGLAEMKAAELETLRTNSVLRDKYGNTDFVTGLFPSEVEVTFNVTAGAANASQLSVDLSAASAQSPVSGSLGGKISASSSATRANQITVKFTSALFGKTSTTTTTNGRKDVVVEGIMDPEKLGAFFDAIGRCGVVRTAVPEAKPQ